MVDGLAAGVEGLRVGVARELIEGCDPDVRAQVDAAVAALVDAGAKVEEASIPSAVYGLSAYYLIAPAEASSNLARYDGVRYGLRVDGDDIMAMYTQTRAAGFGAEVKRRIMLGTYVLSSGYYDAYYLKGQRVRTLIRRDFERAFETVDAILTPTTPTPAFRFGDKTDDPLAMYLSDIYTVTINLAGLPGISIPCGLTRERLPIGLQIIGRRFDEETVLRLAAALEGELKFYRHRPPLDGTP